MDFKSFKIFTLGCKVNQYDSSELSWRLIREGLKRADRDADLVIVNSCAVTKTALIKSRKTISQAKKENPRAKIVLAGCWGKVYEDLDKGETGADLIITERNAAEAVEKLCGKTAGKIKPADNACGTPGSWSRSRYFLKVQDGCEQFCAYCVIPFARGKLKNVPSGKIIAEASRAVDLGYKEIVLCGIHLGLYGTRGEPRQGTGLAGLIQKLFEIKGLGRIRLSSIEINDVSEELISLMMKPRREGEPYLCRHLHIPLQSGCDKILKLMNRPYTAADFKSKIGMIRKPIPELALTTDVIAGFPGETDADHCQTRDFIRNMLFSRLHVFPFSAHEKAPAFKFPEQVSEEEKKKRALELRKIGRELESGYRQKFIGREIDAVVEKKERVEMTCKTEFYFNAVTPTKSEAKIRDIVRLKLDK